MKTLIITGAARPHGHTRQMVDFLLEHLKGETDIIDAYRFQFDPCRDCRYCWKHPSCVINDNMQDVYKLVEQADNIILASPMYFHSVTGRMKTLTDRFQVYWAGHLRQDMPENPVRKGAVIMVGGAPSFPNQFLGGELVLKNLLKDLSTECIGQVCMPNSDHDSLETRPDLKEALLRIAEQLNREGGQDPLT